MAYLDPPKRRTWRWHLQEFGSWLSCGLNVLAGGERDMTFSAASHYLAVYGGTSGQRAWGRRRVRAVDWLNRTLTSEERHCERAFAAVRDVIAARARELSGA